MRTSPSLMTILMCSAVLVLSVNVSAQTPVPEEPTFATDVAPILYRSCVNCHRPDEIAPMSLINYQEVRPWARSIKNKVESRAMPPWHLDRRIGIQDFKNDPSLTEQEIATIIRWVDNGAPHDCRSPLVPKTFVAHDTYPLARGVTEV